jgi:hypothetical protein
MPSPRVRLVVAAVLFAGWVLYLGFLAATTTQPRVLSRPQFLVSDLYVIADVGGDAENPSDTVTVVEAGGPGAGRKEVRPGAELRVALLAKADKDHGWDGPNQYILPLTRLANGTYMLTPLPRSPGYSGDGMPRLYEATAETRRQLCEIKFAAR